MVALAYFACGKLGLSFPTQDSHITLFWLPTGIAVAALLRWGGHCWLGVFLGALSLNLSLGLSLPLAIGIAMGNTLAPLASVWLLKRWHFDPSFSSQHDLFVLIGSAVLGMLLSASAGVCMLWLGNLLQMADATSAWLNWWLGDTVGVLLAGPLLLSMTRASWKDFLRVPAESLLWGMLLIVAGWLAFFYNYSGVALPLAFLPMPLVLWAALRLGVTGTTLAVLLLSSMTAIGTALGKGVFSALPMEAAMYLAWLYMFTIVLTGLMVTTMLGERKQTERALLRANELLALAQREARAGVWDWDMTSGKLTWSDELFILYGLDPETSEANFATWLKLIHPTDLQRTEENIAKALRDELPRFNEYRIVMPNGETRWIAAIGNSRRNERGEMVRMTGLCIDITVHKLAEERIHFSEELLRQSQSVAAIGSWRLNVPSNELVWSDETYRIFGIPVGTPLSYAYFLEQVHLDDRGVVDAAWQGALKGEPYCVQHRIVVDGETRWVEERAKLEWDAQEKAYSGTGSAQDITGRKQAEFATLEVNAHLQAILDAIPDLLFEVDQDGRFHDYHAHPSDLLAAPPEVFIGRTIGEILPPAVAEICMSALHEAMRMGMSTGKEILLHFPQGERWFELSVSTKLAGGRLDKRFIVLSRDITARKQAEASLRDSLLQLEEKELAKTRFLAAAGHDLRQPIAAANLFVDALKFTAPTPRQRELIARLDQSMGIFTGLLERLLDISRLDAGLIKPQVSLFNLVELFNFLELSFAQVAQEKKLHFRFYFSMNKPLFVRTDIGLLQSVLMNLVSNAIKFTSRGGILISARARGDQVLLQVWDTGVGISEADIPRIFDEFYQVANPQRNREAGLGLGLSICKRAMSLLGGKVCCRSRLGRGSVFELTLPLNTEPQGEEPLTSCKVPSELPVEILVEGKRVVVLEDDVLVAEGLINLLQGLGAEVRHFNNAEAALQQDDIMHADFFVVDYALAGNLSGLEFLEAIQKRQPARIRAVIVTGETSAQFISSVSNSHWPVLHKPMSYAKLVSSLCSVAG